MWRRVKGWAIGWPIMISGGVLYWVGMRIMAYGMRLFEDRYGFEEPYGNERNASRGEV